MRPTTHGIKLHTSHRRSLFLMESPRIELALPQKFTHRCINFQHYSATRPSTMHAAPLLYVCAHPATASRKAPIIKSLLGLLHTISARPPILIDADFSALDKRVVRPAVQCEHEEALPLKEYVDVPETLDQIVVSAGLATRPRNTRSALSEHQHAARRSGRVFVPIILSAGDEGSPESIASSPSADEHPPAPEGMQGDEERHPHFYFNCETKLELDITCMTADEAAGKIARWVWWVGEFMSWEEDDVLT